MINFPFGFSAQNNFLFNGMYGLNNNNNNNNFYFQPLFNYCLPMPNTSYQVPMSFPQMPQFNMFPMYGMNTFTAPATSQNNAELNPKQKSQMEEIQKLKYDSKELQAKLNENNNIQDYASFLSSNSDYKVTKTIDAEDGGKIFIYEDGAGKRVGSVNKDANGKIHNVALNVASGGEISLNTSNDDDEMIYTKIAFKKTETTQNKGNSYKTVLAQILNSHKGYTVQKETGSDGKISERYIYKGKMIAFTQKDKSGKILLVEDYSSKADGVKTLKYSYIDSNHNGKIDKGEAFLDTSIEL